MMKDKKMTLNEAIAIINELRVLLNVPTYLETLAFIRNNTDSLTPSQRQAYVVFVTNPL
jgi:hypothetical protein